MFATVRLGVSDFGYRMFALLVLVVSCMDSVHESSAQACPSVHLFQSLLQQHCIFLAHPPLPVYIHSYVFTPGLYRIDMRVFFALWQRA